ncbi:MAG: flagellar protein FlbD [Deltaproteobacteria bacterium]|nr:flagellar protein FlbD [Deltaproteobacteria bacterium]
MIRVTKFDGKSMILNADWIQSVEETPDTVITLTNGSTILVKDSVAEVVAAFEAYKQKQFLKPASSLRKES